MPHADPEKAKAYFAARYQAKRAEIETQKKARRAELGEDEHLRRRREYNRRHKYGLEPAAFDALMLAQGGRCALCAVVFDTAAKRGPGTVCVDHCHATGMVRGLLCRGCNVQVGFIEKDTTRAIAAVEYVLRAYDGIDTDPPAD